MIKYVLLFLILILNINYVYAEQVCKVYDGDTFTTCEGNRIRLFGADAPEKKQFYGLVSKELLAALVLNKNVDLECVSRSYNRKVCKVSQDGQDIASILIKNGAAYHANKYTKKDKEYSDNLDSMQTFAKNNNLGLWLFNGLSKPWEYRKK